jgi:hypothetical protein
LAWLCDVALSWFLLEGSSRSQLGVEALRARRSRASLPLSGPRHQCRIFQILALLTHRRTSQLAWLAGRISGLASELLRRTICLNGPFTKGNVIPDRKVIQSFCYLAWLWLAWLCDVVQLLFYRKYVFFLWIPFGDHPLKLEQYRED